MKSLITYLRYPVLLAFLSVLAAYSDGSSGADTNKSVTTLDVYKSATCQCCSQWIRHMEDAGFDAKTHHPVDLNQFKHDHGIAPEFQSCHTAVSKEGYVFEGHIPARFIHQFLESPSEEAVGLSVPGMPAGSPGMEMGSTFMPYKVWLLKKDGSAEVFASVDSPHQQ